MAAQRKMTFGIVVGNRGFFPDHLAKTGREEIIAVLEAAGARPIVLSPEESKYGAVETYAESQRCAELFKKHAEEIDGIIVTLPNFGEERGIVDAIRLSGLKVPVLVQATPDRSDDMTIADAARQLLRQDERLQQHDAVRHQLFAHHAAYRGACRRPSSRPISSGSLRSAASSRASRISRSAPSGRGRRRSTRCATRSASSRPQVFRSSPSILSEIFGRINRMKDNDDAAQAKLAAIKKYVTHLGRSRGRTAEDGQAGRGRSTAG